MIWSKKLIWLYPGMAMNAIQGNMTHKIPQNDRVIIFFFKLTIYNSIDYLIPHLQLNYVFDEWMNDKKKKSKLISISCLWNQFKKKDTS